jgi:hypothetical protein
METIQVSVLEIDFVNDIILFNTDILADLEFPGRKTKKLEMDEVLKKRFLEKVVDPFWHNDKDKLDFFQYFNTGQFKCQRRKLKHDFSTDTSYWQTYSFTGATQEQADVLYKKALDFYEALIQVRQEVIERKIEGIDKEVIYWEQRYQKARRQKNDLLTFSDWRVLPDVEDTYPGEKDMWFAWRNYVRNYTLKKPSDFQNNLEFFRYTYDIKYPVDPKIYRQIYPNGMLEDGVTLAPAFLDENDPNQWVGHDVAASSDFQRSREQSMYNFSGQYKTSLKKVKQSVLDIMKLLGVDDVVPIDWSIYYADDSELEGKTGT